MIIGLTGGIGSGKTTVAHIFEQLKVPIYYADDRAKFLMNNELDLIAALKNRFGNNIYNSDQQLNREKLSTIIFNDMREISFINSLVHPAVKDDFVNWKENNKADYIIREAAILFESGSYQDCDKVICVIANQELRIQRVMKRSAQSREEVLARIKNQWSDEQRIEKSDYLISNNLEDMLIPQVLKTHESIKRQAISSS